MFAVISNLRTAAGRPLSHAFACLAVFVVLGVGFAGQASAAGCSHEGQSAVGGLDPYGKPLADNVIKVYSGGEFQYYALPTGKSCNGPNCKEFSSDANGFHSGCKQFGASRFLVLGLSILLKLFAVLRSLCSLAERLANFSRAGWFAETTDCLVCSQLARGSLNDPSLSSSLVSSRANPLRGNPRFDLCTCSVLSNRSP